MKRVLYIMITLISLLILLTLVVNRNSKRSMTITRGDTTIEMESTRLRTPPLADDDEIPKVIHREGADEVPVMSPAPTLSWAQVLYGILKEIFAFIGTMLGAIMTIFEFRRKREPDRVS